MPDYSATLVPYSAPTPLTNAPVTLRYLDTPTENYAATVNPAYGQNITEKDG